MLVFAVEDSRGEIFITEHIHRHLLSSGKVNYRIKNEDVTCIEEG